MKYGTLFAVILSLTASNAHAEASDMCHAQRLQKFIGNKYNPRMDKNFSKISSAKSVRIIKYGAAITEDYSLERLNINVDLNGKISKIWCG